MSDISDLSDKNGRPKKGYNSADNPTPKGTDKEANREYRKQYYSKSHKTDKGNKNFILAKNKEEAIEFTQKHIGEIVNWGSISLDNINIINKELFDLKKEIPILNDKYKVIGKNGKWGNGVVAHASDDIIEFNPRGLTDSQINKILNKAKRRKKDLMTQLNLAEKYPWIYDAQDIVQLKEELKFEKYSVVESLTKDKYLRGVVTHETGHTILYRKALQEGIKNLETTKTYQLVTNTYNSARLNGDIYKISQYANEDIHEFFSETFLMYRFDKHKLPGYIIDMIKEIIK